MKFFAEEAAILAGLRNVSNEDIEKRQAEGKAKVVEESTMRLKDFMEETAKDRNTAKPLRATLRRTNITEQERVFIFSMFVEYMTRDKAEKCLETAIRERT